MPSRAEPRLGDVRLEEEPPPPALLLSGAGTWPQAAAAAGRAPPSPPPLWAPRTFKAPPRGGGTGNSLKKSLFTWLFIAPLRVCEQPPPCPPRLPFHPPPAPCRQPAPCCCCWAWGWCRCPRPARCPSLPRRVCLLLPLLLLRPGAVSAALPRSPPRDPPAARVSAPPWGWGQGHGHGISSRGVAEGQHGAALWWRGTPRTPRSTATLAC